MKPLNIIAIGAAIVLIPPVILGFIVAHFTNPGAGLFSALVLLGAILYIAHRRIKQFTKNNKGD